MTSTRWWRPLAALAAGLLLVTGCSGTGTGNGLTPLPGSSTATSVPSATGLPRPAHVVIVVFENKAEHQVLGSGDAPYLTSLAQSGARFTDSHGVAYPSQPNYLALFSGSTQGVTDDSCPQDLGDRPNLAEQLVRAGYTFAGYSESMPAAGFTGCTDAERLYARKHNPWVDFSNVSASSNLPLSALPEDLSKLPTLSFVIPNLCNDMHNCAVAEGDRWAREHLAPYVTWAAAHDGLLIVTFDEDDRSSGNRIPTFFVGPMVKAGSFSQPVNHYNVLRTIEDMYGLEPLGEARGAAALAGWAR